MREEIQKKYTNAINFYTECLKKGGFDESCTKFKLIHNSVLVDTYTTDEDYCWFDIKNDNLDMIEARKGDLIREIKLQESTINFQQLEWEFGNRPEKLGWSDYIKKVNDYDRLVMLYGNQCIKKGIVLSIGGCLVENNREIVEQYCFNACMGCYFGGAQKSNCID